MDNGNMIQAFHNAEFGDVRVLKESADKYLFCASDAAKALGYSNAPDAIRRHCKGIVKRDTLTNGGKQTLSSVKDLWENLLPQRMEKRL